MRSSTWAVATRKHHSGCHWHCRHPPLGHPRHIRQRGSSAPLTGCVQRLPSHSSPRTAAPPGASRRCRASDAPPGLRQCDRFNVSMRPFLAGRPAVQLQMVAISQAAYCGVGGQHARCAQVVTGGQHRVRVPEGFWGGLHWRRLSTFSLGKPLAGSAMRLYAALSERLILPCGKFSFGTSVPAAGRVPVVSDKAKSSQPAGEEITCRHLVLASRCLHQCYCQSNVHHPEAHLQCRT